jgi:hypothetical protein
MDPPPPGSWRLDWRDYKGHHAGKAQPPTFHKRFKTEEAARCELARLGAVPGAAVVGFIAAVPRKPPSAEQTDFGFPADGKRRLTD